MGKLLLVLLLIPSLVLAAPLPTQDELFDLTTHWLGFSALLICVIAYALVLI